MLTRRQSTPCLLLVVLTLITMRACSALFCSSHCATPPCLQVVAGLDAALQAQLARLTDVWWGRPLFKSGVANEARR